MSKLSIRWIGQSGYLLCDGITQICIDPYLSDVVNRVANRKRMVEAPFAPQELRCDALICTHDHLDHTDIDALPLMNKDDMIFLAPTPVKKTLLECGVTQYVDFNEGDVYQIGNFEIRAVFADHSVPAIGVVIRFGAYTLYFSGDTEYNERLCELSGQGIDAMFICINGRLGNMGVDDAVRVTRAISPKIGIPTHYGMFESNTEDPEKYTSRIDNGFIMSYNVKYTLEEMLNYV